MILQMKKNKLFYFLEKNNLSFFFLALENFKFFKQYEVNEEKRELAKLIAYSV